MGSHEVRQRQRQFLPHLDEQLVFRVQRIVVRQRLGPVQLVFVGQVLGREAPVLLEVVGAGTELAAAEVEQAAAARGRGLHQVPVHEVVAGHFARQVHPAAVVGHDFIAPVERQHGRDQAVVFRDDAAHLAFVAEDLLQQGKVFFREHRGAEAVHAARIRVEHAVDVGVDFAAQAQLDPLAHHRALLARDGVQVGFVVARDLLAEGDVQFLGVPAGVARVRALHAAVFEVADAELARQRIGGAVQHGQHGRMFGDRAAVHAERHRAQRMAEQAALDFGQRQHADDAAVLLDVVEEGLDAERSLDHRLPAGQVEEGGGGGGAHEGVPAAVGFRLEQVQAQGPRRRCRRAALFVGGFDDRVHGRPRKMRSMRSQAKSRASASRRPSIRSIFT